MAIVIDEFLLKRIVQGATLPILIYMSTLLGRKWNNSKNEEGKRSPIRLLIFLQIFCWSLSGIFSFFLNIIYGEISWFYSVNPVSIALVSTIMMGITLIGYMYNNKMVMGSGWYFYGGILLYELATRTGTAMQLQFVVVMGGNILFLIVYFYQGIKFKDDKILGLAIFFVFPFFSWAQSRHIILYLILNIGIAVYGTIYATGKLKFFREYNKQKMVAEIIQEVE